MQILFTGVEALAITAVLAVGLGAVIIIQGMQLLPQFGQGQLLYRSLIIVITRELGPLLTAFIIISRSATAITTELGTMVTHHEVEAYLATGIDPIAHRVVPRVLGVTISLLFLNVYFNVFGLLGSYLVTRLIRPIQFREYFFSLIRELTLIDLSAGIVAALNSIGAVHLAVGENHTAEGYFQDAYSRARALGAAEELMESANSLGDLDQAEAHFRDALAINLDLRQLLEAASNRYMLASVAAQRGRYQEAKEHASAALQLDKQMEYSLGIAKDLKALGIISVRLDEPRAALDYFERSFEVFLALEMAAEVAEVLDLLAETADSLGKSTRADAYRAERNRLR